MAFIAPENKKQTTKPSVTNTGGFVAPENKPKKEIESLKNQQDYSFGLYGATYDIKQTLGDLQAQNDTSGIRPSQYALPTVPKKSEAEKIIKQAYQPDLSPTEDNMSLSRVYQQQEADKQAQSKVDFLKAKTHEDGTPITKEEKQATVKEILDIFDSKKQSAEQTRKGIEATYLPLLNKYQNQYTKTPSGDYENIEYQQLSKTYQDLLKKYDVDNQMADKAQKELAQFLPEIVEIPTIDNIDGMDDGQLKHYFGEVGIDKSYIGKINDQDNAEAAKLAYNQKQETYNDVYSLDSPFPFHDSKTQTKGNPQWVNEAFQKQGGYQVISNFSDKYKKSIGDYQSKIEEYQSKIEEYNQNPTKEGYEQLQNYQEKVLNPLKKIADKNSQDLKRLIKLQEISYPALSQWEQKQQEQLNLDLSTWEGQMTAAFRSLSNKNAHIFTGLEQTTSFPERLFKSKDEYLSNRIATQNRTKELTFAVPEEYHKTPIMSGDFEISKPFESLKKVNWANLVAKNLETTAFSLEIAGVTAMTGGGANAIIPVTYAMTYGDALYNAREQGLNENQASVIASFQSLIEGLTERISPLEAKIFNPETYTTGTLKQLTKEQIIKQLFKQLTGKEIKEPALNYFLGKTKELGKKAVKSVAAGSYVVLQETAEELAGDPLNQMVDIVASNNIQGYTYDPISLETLKNTAITSASTMALMGLWGAGTNVINPQISSYNLDLATKPDYYLSSLQNALNIGYLPDLNLKNGQIIPSQQFYQAAEKNIKNLASIYQANKSVIDNLEEKSEQASYINLISEQKKLYDVLAKYNPVLSSLTKEQEKEIEKIQLSINSYQQSINNLNQKAFENLSLSKEERNKKQEEKVYEGTSSQFTDEFINKIVSPDQIRYFQKNLEDRYTYAPTERMKQLVSNISDKLTERLKYITNKPTSELIQETKPIVEEKPVKEPQKTEEKSVFEQTKEKINFLSKEELENYRIPKNLTEEEKEQILQEKLNKLDELENQETTITLTDRNGKDTIQFKEGDYVTYQGDTYRVRKNSEGKGILYNDITKAEKSNFDISEIKPKPISTKPTPKQTEETFEDFGEATETERPIQETIPTEDTEAKKAEVKRLEKELFEKSIPLKNWTSVEHNKYVILLGLRGDVETRGLLRNLEPSASWQLYAVETLSEEEAKEVLNNVSTYAKADIPIGKVGNTHYEVKADGVYFEGKKLDNPENKTHRQLIEADIERRREEELFNIPDIIKPARGKNVNLKDKDGNWKDKRTVIEATEDVIKFETREGQDYSKFLDKGIQQEYVKKLQTAIEKAKQINAKYDAELKAVGQQSTTTTQSEIEAKKAEIKRKKQAELKPLERWKAALNDESKAREVGTSLSDWNYGVEREIKKIEDRIAEYTAKIAALEQQETKTVTEEPIIEQEVSGKKPENPEKVKKEQDKEIIQKFEEPANPFKNGKVKSSNWNEVVSTIKNIANYKVKVVDTNSLKFENLPFNTQQYFEEQALKSKTSVEDVMSKDKGKMLVLTNEKGEIIYFKEKPLVSNFPDGKLALWKDSYEKQGLTEQQYYDKIEQIKKARANNSVLTIDRISNYPVQITTDNTTLGVAVADNPVVIKIGSKGFPSAFVGDQELPLTSRKLTDNEIDTIIAISKNFGSSGQYSQDPNAKLSKDTKDKSERFQKLQFIQKLILTGDKYINFRYFQNTEKDAENFKKYGNSTLVTIKGNPATEEELRDYLKKQWINIDVKLSQNSNWNFTTYQLVDGKIEKLKVYNNYLDFLKENTTTKGVSATKIQDNFYIEVGDIDNSLAASIEKAKEEPKEPIIVEQVKPIISTIEQQSPALDEFKDILNKQKKKEEPKSDKDDFTGLLRNKSLSQKVTEEQKQEAIEWFKSSPLAQFIFLNQFQNIINSDAYATWLPSAITLWKGSEYTDLYHEAWHEFSQLYLTKEQKTALYKELKALNVDILLKDGSTIKSSEASDKDLEEYYAEDFRNYVLSGQKLILNNRVKRNSIFRKIYNFLKEFITGNVDLQTYYERLYTGNISKYKRDLNNSFFGNLNTGIENKNGKKLSSTDTKNLYRAIDSLVGTIFQQNNKPVTMMFADNNVLGVVYSAIYKRFIREYNELLESIQDRLQKGVADDKLRADVQTLNNLEFVTENWNNIISDHKKYSAFFNISKDKIAFDEDGNATLIDDLYDDTTDEGNDRNSELIKNENVSSKEAASNETIFTIATLQRYNPDGTKAQNPFLPFVSDIVDFNSAWDQLTTATNNTLEYSQIVEKIEELGKKDKSFQDLVERIPNPEKTLTDDEQRLKGAFMNDVSKPLVHLYELVFTPNEKGGIRTSYKTAASSDVDKIKNLWFDQFQQYSPFLEEDEDGSLFVNKELIKEKYSFDGTNPAFFGNIKDYKAQDKQQLFENRVQFLEDLGFNFSEETLSNPEFRDLVTEDFIKTGNFTNHSVVYSIYDLLTKTDKSISSLKDLIKLKPSSNSFKYFNSAINQLAEFELQNSSTLFAQSVKNAEQNNVWQIRQWNYITKVFNALNDYKKYPTYQDLVKEEWLKQFDETVNPYVKGIYLNSLFDLTPNSPSYGQRRVIKKGNQTTYPTIELQDYNGLRLNNQDGQTNEGKATTSLTPFEKLAQNINSLLLFNTQENLRYGDKSSSFSIKMSHLVNTNTGKLEEVDSIIPLTSFIDNRKQTVLLPEKAYKYLLADLKQEIIPMINYVNNQTGIEFKHYNKHIKNFGVFDGILTKETKQKIKEQIIDKNLPIEEIAKVLQSLPIKQDLEIYIQKQSDKLYSLLDTKGLLSDKDFLDPKLLETKSEDSITKIDKRSLTTAYVVNSLLYNIEHTKIVSFDPRFYKNAKDVIKRLSAFSATGNIFVVDEQTNNFIHSKGNLIKDAVAKKLGIEIPNIFPDGKIKSAIFTDNEYSATKLFEQYKEAFLKTGKYTSEQLNNVLKAYKSINEADGQGFTTLDLYRESKLRAGSSHWTKEHKIAYQKEAAFLAGESTEGMNPKELTLFVVQKWQYAGIGLSKLGIPYPTFYKFSVVPLIPSMIKGTNFETIHDNLVKQNIGLGLFESGSKASSVQELEYNEDGSIKLDDKGNPIGKFNPFYEDYNTRTPFTGEYTTNDIFFQYLKEQVNTEPELKGKSTFSTQMRKLLHLNLFNNGVPNDVSLSYEEWFKLPKSEKLKLSPIYKSEQRFGDVIEKLIEIEQQSLIKKMGAVLQPDDTYKLDAAKLQEFFKEEFIKRNLPNEVINYLQVEGGEFQFPLDAFKKRETLERIAYSIANKKLVQQKINGEALVQVASTGFELTDRFSEVKEDSDLPFYQQEFDKDGNPLPTKAQKVKIAFTPRWKPLLNLTYKGEKIKTLNRLNKAIKDEGWLSENRKAITIVGVRIPVQGLNSQEFMEVFEFLPESAGGVIIVSPALVAKSGGDFDIDKLTIFFPNLFENRYTGETKLYKSSDIKFNDKEVGAKLRELSQPSKAKFDELRKIRRGLRAEIDALKEQKEGINQSKQEVKKLIKRLDVEIAVLKENRDFLEEVEFALQTEEDFSWISERVADIGGVDALQEATGSALEQTKQAINAKIQQAELDKHFLLKSINSSIDILNQDINYSRLEIKNIDNVLNPLREYLANMQEIVYQSSAKKAYENELIDIIRETLSIPDNFLQLVRPNDTDILNNNEYGAEALKKIYDKGRDNTFTSVVDFASILQEFESNLVGKANLGIAAVANVFFALSQRAGLFLNEKYTYRDFTGKLKTKNLEFYLPHNTVKVNNKEHVSLSGLSAKDAEYYVSDVISQFINGFVDVAKDDWVFFINGVKEFTPTMLYTTMAGVNAKTNIAFFNQPIMRNYIKNVSKYKNLFVKQKDKEAFNMGLWKAIQDTVLEYAQKGGLVLKSDEELRKEHEEGIKLGQIGISFENYKKEEIEGMFFLVYNRILKNVNPEFLNEKRLTEALFENKPLSTDEQIFLLLHYYELRRQSGIITNLQRSLNSDTKKAGSYYNIIQRQQLFEDAKNSGMFDIAALNRMRNDSTIKAFTNDKTGFDAFVSNLYSELFEVVNHPTFNKTIKSIIDTDKELEFDYKFSKVDKFISTLKNDFITYLYQNHAIDENEPLFKKIKPLFSPKTSIAKELKAIKLKYPNLSQQFPILNLLTSDNLKDKNGRILKVNLKLQYPLKDKDQLDDVVNQMRNLLQFTSPKYTPEEQIEIQKFADKLTKFAIIQSGLNNSVYNIMDIVPNEIYTNLIKSRIKLVRQQLEKDKALPFTGEKSSPSAKGIQAFYKKWKTQRPNFFKFTADEEGLLPPANYQSQRGLDLFQEKSDLTGEKQKQFEEKLIEQTRLIPNMSNVVDRITFQIVKKEPKTLFVIQKSDEKNFIKEKTFNYVAVDIVDNEDVDKFINKLIEKSLDYNKITLQSKGYLQDKQNTDLFNYFSQRLQDLTNITNPNFVSQEIPLSSQQMEEQKTITPTVKPGVKEVNTIKQSNNPAEQIYSQLGNKTKSENVIIDEVNGRKPAVESNLPTKDVKINIYAGANQNTELSNFAIRPFKTNVETSSGSKEYTFQSVEQGFHFYKAVVANNPQIAAQILKTTNGGTLRNLTSRSNLKMTPEQVKEWDNTSKSIMLNLMYDSYAQNPDKAQLLLNTGEATITHTQDNTRWKTDFPEVVMTVRDMLREEGFDKNQSSKPIVAYRTRGNNFLEALEKDNAIGNPWSHLGSGQNENLTKKNLFTVKPIQAADKKAIVKASVATQFIGFGEGIAGSSTESYRQQILGQSNLIDFQEEQSSGYIERTRKNASADATIDFGLNQLGEPWTKKAVDNNKKKYIGINTNNLTITSEMVAEIVEGLNSVNAKTLNIAGMGIYNMKNNTQEQVDEFVYNLLKQVIESPTLKIKIQSIRTGGQTGFDEAGAKAAQKLGIKTIVLAPKGYIFRNKEGKDIANKQEFENRFNQSSIVNSGNYSSNDVIFVSVGGKRGNEQIRKEQQDRTIKEALKAIENGATLITDNKSYVESSDYNEGEKRLAKNLESKGYSYSEQTIDGQLLGVWTKNQSTQEIKPGVSELFESKRSFADYSDFGKTLSEQQIINLKKEGNKVTAKQFLESIIPVNDFEKKLKSFLLSIDLNKLNNFDFVINNKYQGNIIGLNERELFEKPTVIFNSKATNQPSRYKLHEFLHSLLDTVINQEQEFRTELISLYDYVKTLPEFKNEYGVIGWWEFYTEGMTNPYFQAKLKNVTLSGYKGRKKSSVYKEFIKIINSLLEKLGFVNKDYSALDEIINATTKVIEKRYGYGIKPGVQELFDSNPELANEIYEALREQEEKNLEDLYKEAMDIDEETIEERIKKCN